MSIVGIDIDSTLASDRYESGGVLNCTLLPGAKEKVAALKAAGHSVVFFTHRGEHLRDDTLDWLKRNGIVYDDIIFEKPHFDVYIGDEAIHFESWDKIDVGEL